MEAAVCPPAPILECWCHNGGRSVERPVKLFKLSTHYPSYLAHWYAAHPSAVEHDYRTQKAELDEDSFAWFDTWERALLVHGWTTFDAVANAEPLQRAWAREA